MTPPPLNSLSWTLFPLHGAAAFAPHAAAWDALQSRVAGLPFLESAFLTPLLSVFGSGRERLALQGDPKAPRAAAIVAPAGSGQWTTFQPSQLPLGAWLSPAGEPLEPLAAGLLRALPFPALALGLTQLDSLFHPRAADGPRWREAETPLPVTVRPRFHETGWFHFLVALAAIGVFAGGVALRMRQLRRRQIEMERLVAQRTEELRQANEHLKQLSFLDALTGLPNRRRFNEAADEEWRRARRTGSPLGLVLADVDAFKRYNDQMGHLKGDECLATVGAVLGASIGRAGDLAARYGGEEFVVLLPGADRDATMRVAEHIRAGIESLAMPHPASPAGPVVTLSLGVAACVPGEENSLAGLIAQADDALYAAKREGRNRVR